MKKSIGFLILALTYLQSFGVEPVVVPIVFTSGAPVVNLTLNGKTILFTLDTGSSRAFHLSKAAAKQFPELKYTGSKAKSFDLGGNMQESAEVFFDQLSVDGMKFGKTTGVTLTPWGLALGKGSQLDPELSILGLGFFDNKKVIIDYGSNTLTIADEDDTTIMQRVSGWSSVPFDKSDEGLVLVFTNDKANYRLVIDSPSTMSVVKTKVAEERDVVQPCDVNLGPKQTCRTISVSLQSGREIKPFLLDLPLKFAADGLVGQEFFFQYAIFLDITNHTVLLKSNTDCSTVPVTFRVRNVGFVSGQKVYVNGDQQALGNWDPTAVNQLKPDDNGASVTWSNTLYLPPATAIQFKYMKHDGSGYVWEADLSTNSGNRQARTQACGAPALVLDAVNFQ